jgi:hypothetical protein
VYSSVFLLRSQFQCLRAYCSISGVIYSLIFLSGMRISGDPTDSEGLLHEYTLYGADSASRSLCLLEQFAVVYTLASVRNYRAYSYFDETPFPDMLLSFCNPPPLPLQAFSDKRK